MTSEFAKFRWLILTAYPAAGLLFGLADPWLGRFAQQLGVRPGLATAVTVNLLLPLAVVGLAVVRPSLVSVVFGAVSMTAGLILGLAVNYHGGREWSFADVPPVLVVATVGYVVLGSVAALVRSRLATA